MPTKSKVGVVAFNRPSDSKESGLWELGQRVDALQQFTAELVKSNFNSKVVLFAYDFKFL